MNVMRVHTGPNKQVIQESDWETSGRVFLGYSTTSLYRAPVWLPLDYALRGVV